jgi:acetyl esterase/lipase
MSNTNKGSEIPTTGTRTKLVSSIEQFLKDNSSLHLGGDEDFHGERRKHLEVFGIHSIPKEKQHPIGEVEFTAVRGPHGTIPVRVLYPKSGEEHRKKGEAGALIYFHGGGYTVGSVDEFENGLRLLAEESGVQVYGIDYRLAPEFKFPTQLDEYDAIIDWLQSSGGKERGVHPDLVSGGGDSAGGNMTAAISLRRRDENKKPLNSQVLLYPEARLPFDTPAAAENNSGYYLECNGIFSFADHYLPRGTPPGYKYISPGMQDKEYLKGQSRAGVYTSGFDPLRDVGVEYAHKNREAGNEIVWRHYDGMTHGWLQMTAWSGEARDAVKDVAGDLKKFTYG